MKVPDSHDKSQGAKLFPGTRANHLAMDKNRNNSSCERFFNRSSTLENVMDPRDKQRPAKTEETEAPTIEQQDWDALEGGRILPDSVAVNGDPQDDAEPEGDLPEEDDDNPFQESDEALPDDEEERVLSKDPSKEGSRFDEV